MLSRFGLGFGRRFEAGEGGTLVFYILEGGRIDPGPFNQGSGDRRRQFSGRDIRKSSAETAERCAKCFDNVNLVHKIFSTMLEIVEGINLCRCAC